MIRIGLFSGDGALHPLLGSALGKDFTIQLKPDENSVLELVEAGGCDVLLLDLSGNGHLLQQRIGSFRRLIDSGFPAIVMGDDSVRPLAFELVREGAFGYCRKPPSIRDLKTMLSRACELHDGNLQRQAGLTAGFDRMIGSSRQMRRVYELVNRVADLNCSVLVAGESGAGKELIARAIHNQGSRAERPFVAVSCGAIPETLIEAELFGHEKGAFTGAMGTRQGCFEKAEDGTLLLDEIGDLSLFTQVKLLRALQQMEFSRLGSNRLIPLRARLVFATHRDLAKLVAEGKFRQDLYYRINVMQIPVPALRERSDDIPRIAEHFLRHYSAVFQKPMTGIEPEAMGCLENYAWPGNVRELENVMQRAIILSAGRTVRTEDLAIGSREEEEADNGEVVDIGDYQLSSSFERQLRDYKVKLAAAAVRENNGNKTMAARSLGISRAYVHRLIRLSENAFEAEMKQAANS